MLYNSEKEARQAIVNFALKYKGTKEGSAQHHLIIDAYNAVTPRPRNYKVTYTDAWCATFVTFCFDSLNIAGLIERECGCQEMINKCKKRNLVDFAKKSDSQVIGNIVMYDWEGDNHADHVGIITEVTDTQLKVVEGNYNDAVGVRLVPKNYAKITAYIKPHYEVLVGKTYDYENLGWNKDNNGWWYATGHYKGQYHKNNVVRIDNDLYAFDTEGYLCDLSKTTFTDKGSIMYIGGKRL